MADDKPKHKPQAKRTLEEVLRSLKDLVRNDLTDERRARPAAPAAISRPLAADEPESFNEALTRLDAIIDEKIVKPARAAPAAAPPATAADIDIDWGELTGPQEAADDAPTLSAGAAPDAPAFHAAEGNLGPATLDDGAGEPEYQLEGAADASAELAPTDAADLAALEAIELAPIAPEEPPQDASSEAEAPRERAAAMQEAFSFLELERERDTDDPAPAPEDSARYLAPDPPAAAPPEFSDTGDRLRLAESDAAHPARDGRGASTVQAAPMPGDSNDANHEPRAVDPPQAAMSDDTGERQSAGPAGAGTDDAGTPAGDAGMNRRAEPARHRDASVNPGAEPPTLEHEIPVLQDLAPGQSTPSPALPDADHARDIAIRVIARINIERRKAGETPLDIKTIERLQRYLSEALTKAAAGRK